MPVSVWVTVLAIGEKVITYIVNAEVIQSLSNLNLLSGIEEGIGELLPLSKCRLDDLEVSNIWKEVTDWLVWVLGVDGSWAIAHSLESYSDF